MKIVHCLDHYMPLHFAGTEIYVHTLAKLQKAAGHDVVVLTPFFSYYASADRQFMKHYVYDTVDVHQYMEGSSPNDKNILSGKNVPQGLIAFARHLIFLKPDIVHFHELTRNIGFGVAHVVKAKEIGARIILTMHLAGNTCNTGNLINHGRLCPGQILKYDCSVCTYKTLYKFPEGIAVPVSKIASLLDRTGIIEKLPRSKAITLLSVPSSIKRIRKDLEGLIDHVDQFVSLTEWYKKIMVLNGVIEERITVVQQALATEQPSIETYTYLPATLPLKLVFVGRIQIQKGVHLLIEAMNKLSGRDVRLDIYGKEEETTYYKNCIEQSKHNSAIVWKGTIARETVVQCLTGYHLLCLPSTFSEMSPFVIQEAFAAGIPVLASKVYGNMEQITDGRNGWLFEFNNSDDLFIKINALLNDPELIDQARKNIVHPKPFTMVAAMYEKLYSQKSSLENS